MKNSDNLKWLKSLRETDVKLNLDELINKAQSAEEPDAMAIEKFKFDYRKLRALEIIAEELIKHNETAGCIVTVLENIETILARR